ncbi:hypothetical protein DM01DRAFT_1307105 [Hesseltinella vesiculosa]|uniref:Uncharacterized protein n=1 Tax=Hesseltinella vesiculosa TaxID=101127 RepID=A0A1X2GED6_9FUNG|nr:hypothetical protein DM01DRAFT_1307105 [Hesseltinella vesiculosa]
MYHAMAYGCVMGGMAILSFDPSDIAHALNIMKDANQLAKKNRLHSWKQSVGKFSTKELKKMTPLQRHAELVYAETTMLKIGLQILHDQSAMLALKESIKAYRIHIIYKELESYLFEMQKLSAVGAEVDDFGLDGHLVSGIAFGMAGFNLFLSAVPEFILKLLEFVGFTGDRALGITASPWAAGPTLRLQNQKKQSPDEGLRRQFCDLVLVGYNLIVSKLAWLSYVDESLGNQILDYSLLQYPNGMVFLALKGRHLATQRRLEEAKDHYQRAKDAQSFLPQLGHVCYWELGTLALVEQDWRKAHDNFRVLLKENRWSRCVFAYMQGLTLYLMALDNCPPGEKRSRLMDTSAQLMDKVTSLKQKIAGRSIFIEKFVARKARKFGLQGKRLLFPDLEILYAIGALELMPVALIQKNLGRINATLKRLENSRSYYVHDDIALSQLLRAVLFRLLLEQQEMDGSIYQLQSLTAEKQKKIKDHPLVQLHQQALDQVLVHAPLIKLDHWLYFFGKFEQAQRMIMTGELAEARRIMAWLLKCSEKKSFKIESKSIKSKYSMENALILKCHSCIGFVDELTGNSSV